MRAESSIGRLRTRIRADQRRIARGERPAYHATWTTTPDGAADVTILELPIIHLFVPDHVRVPDGARGLIARTLAVDAASFDVVIQEPPAR
ncbi:MAG TPA: hypothetical protein VF323_04775 [Candidatus Limnocylindrales bacterium]